MRGKQAFYGCFLEKHDTQNLEYFIHTGGQSKLLFQDGNQYINADGNPYLGFDCVGRGAVEGLYPKVLLDPFEKQFDLPAELVQTGNGPGRQVEVVGQKEELLLEFDIDVVNPSQEFGIKDRAFRAGQSNGLIAAQTPVFVDRMGSPP